MFRFCSQFKLKMNIQTDTTLNDNFDGNENTSMKVNIACNDKLHQSFKMS